MAQSPIDTETPRQLFRYVVVGLISNVALYACYLLLSARGVPPKSAMTTVYCMGLAGTFIFNRQWTFRHSGAVRRSLIRYIATYAGAYLFSFLAMHILVDIARLPHQLVMIAVILACATMVFTLQKFLVFRPERGHAG